MRELDVAGASERQALAVTLTPDWGIVSLNTSPPGATVLVDGAEAGVTPAAIEIMSGEHDVEVRLAGHNAWRTKVLVESNQPQQLPDVTLAQADGRVEVASNPSEASVSVDGEFRGRTPLSLRLSPGRTHRLALTKPGYETATSELSVGSRQRPAIANRPDAAVRRHRGREHAAGRRMGRRAAARLDPGDAPAHGHQPRDRDAPRRVSPSSARS